MERRGFLLNGTVKESWVDADSSIGFKDGSLDEGTPGTINAFLKAEIDAMQFPAPAPVVIQTDAPVANTVVDSTPIAVVEPVPIVTSTDPALETESMCTDVVATTDLIPTNPAVTTGTTDQTSTVVPPVEPTIVETPSAIESATTTTQTITEAPVVTTTTSATTSTPAVAPESLQVNELYPHPETGEPEWVEVLNTSSSAIVTNGWSLVDESGAVTLFPNGEITPGSFLVMENPKGKLNNDGDTVIIKDPSGNVIDAVMYNADLGLVPALGESLIRTGLHALAITTTPTKNSENVETQKSTTTSATATTSSSSTSNTNPEISIVATNTTSATTSPIVSSTSTTTLQTDNSTTIIPISHAIHLSEFYPNTGGTDSTDEFIEIRNDGTEPVSLSDWSVTDSSGTRFTFAKTDTIASNAFLAIMRPQSHITLNNTGDTITLFAPDGSIADSKTYDQANATFSFAIINGVWTWTGTPTPNEQNSIPQNNEPVVASDPIGTIATAPSAQSTSTNGTISARVLTIADAKLANDGTRLTVRGFVTVLPNVFNSQTMYVQDDTGGIQIYKSNCRFPNLVMGQEVTITGTLSHINGEVRLKVANTATINVGSTVSTVTASTVSPDNQNTSIGSLMTIAGMVISRSGNQAFVDVDGKKWTVDLPKGSPVDTALFTKGSRVEVSGIMTQSQNNLHLKPRSDQDISVTNTANKLESTPVTNTSESQKQTTAIILALVASVLLVGLKFRPHLYALIKSYGRKSTLAFGSQKAS